ncbi:unnamed protein product [Umbelopsis vinacea]
MSEANIIREEDTAEYIGGDDMNFWLQRCSICLDSKFSLFLDSCRDQFCADCFASPIDHSPDFVKIVIQSWWPVDMNVQEDFAVKVRATQLAEEISLLFVSMEIIPDYWKSLQFAHIAYFPDVACQTCDRSTCLRCGAFSHPGMTCRENLQFSLQINDASDENDTIRWKFENSRCCPSCSIMIHRDEGCNKVDCSLCGYRFCWACLSAWSEKCGFYQCGYQQDQQATGDVALEAKTELGVPDVLTIERRYSTSTTATNGTD